MTNVVIKVGMFIAITALIVGFFKLFLNEYSMQFFAVFHSLRYSIAWFLPFMTFTTYAFVMAYVEVRLSIFLVYFLKEHMKG